ncbi:hypothetical protein BH11CYA1_BH11CYA1_00280 [soil metagenome]
MKVASVAKISTAFYFGLGLVVSCAAICTTPTWAQAYPDSQLLKMTFDAKDFQATSRLAADMISRHPNNSYAHYYLGRSLARLGKIGAARYELVKCQKLSHGTELGTWADQAIAELLPYDAEPDKNRIEPKLSSVHTQERERLLVEQEKEMDAAQHRFDEKVGELQKSSTPAELKTLTQAEFTKLSLEQSSITERYQRRADLILRRGTIPSSGLPTLPPLSGSRGVQNYINAGDPSRAATIPSENPMHASALKLRAGTKNEPNKSPVARKNGTDKAGGK